MRAAGRAEAWAAMLPLVAEIEARGLAAARGHRNTAELFG
jgi:hypothetical protein